MEKRKHHNHLIWIILGCIAVTAMIVGMSMTAARERARLEAYDALKVEVNEEMLKVEYGTPADLSSFVLSSSAEAATSDQVDEKKMGKQTVTYVVKGQDSYGNEVEKEFPYVFEVVDTQAPVITTDTDTINVIDDADTDVYSHIVSVADPVDGDLKWTDVLDKGTYTFSVEGDTALIQAEDNHGNRSEKTLNIIRMQTNKDTAYPYKIDVNRAANTVTVYAMDLNGEYSIPYKAMVCSTGKATPLGTYNTTAQYRWISLIGNVWGQYSTRIVGAILFHSVPYFSQNMGDLEYEEYNKLGTNASLGCVRLSVEDTKWIYDNCPVGTAVTFYDDADNPGPLGKPSPITIDVNDERRGWDPTDPDASNPWNQ